MTSRWGPEYNVYGLISGLLYMCFKHVVDRHNIYYAAKPTKMTCEPHQRAVNFVHTGVVLLQLNIVAFTMLRTRTDQTIDDFLLIIIILEYRHVKQ